MHSNNYALNIQFICVCQIASITFPVVRAASTACFLLTRLYYVALEVSYDYLCVLRGSVKL